jgi:Helix-turn-helix domain
VNETTIEPLLLRPDDAAKALAISERKLRYLTAAGELPCVRLDRAVRYDVADLRCFIELKKTKVPPSTAGAS